ncbi:hypothetical protein LguiA_018201 [Lonicera macranthoides]
MEKSQTFKSFFSNEDEVPSDEVQEFFKTFTKEDKSPLYKKSFWCPTTTMKAMASVQKHFQSQDTDILVATAIKSGTTWLKAITFSIMNRAKYSHSKSPLLTTSPHGLFPSLELDLYFRDENPNLDGLIPLPRLLSTHVPYDFLLSSILDSKCRIVYICRNPLDQFVSYWFFRLSIMKNLKPEDNIVKTDSLDKSFKLFCRGKHSFGPFWEHALGYWRASIESPHKVLFLKYEDLKEDINYYVKKIAEFLEFPFSLEEEKQGIVDEISNMCSLKSLKILEVNKVGRHNPRISNSAYFRNGQVGDWVNLLSPFQAEYLEKIAEKKLAGSGLTFKVSCKSSF